MRYHINPLINALRVNPGAWTEILIGITTTLLVADGYL
jgi:hypothetical protein